MAGVAVAGVVAILSTTLWWADRGETLTLGVAVGSGPSPVNVPLSFAGTLGTTHGHPVELTGVRAIGATDGLQVEFHRLKDGDLGTYRGSLADAYAVAPLLGTRIEGPLESPDATRIAISVAARRPGLYRLPRIEVSYHSGWRTRSVTTTLNMCMLVLSDSDYATYMAALPAAPGGRLGAQSEALDRCERN